MYLTPPCYQWGSGTIGSTFQAGSVKFPSPSMSNHSGVPGAILLYTTYSQSELLNGRQIRTKIDILFPSLAHIAQGKQARVAMKCQEQEFPVTGTPIYSVDSLCYTLYRGPKCEKDHRRVTTAVTVRFDVHSVNVQVVPQGGMWWHHIEQLHPHYVEQGDEDPGELPSQIRNQLCPSRKRPLCQHKDLLPLQRT